MKALVTGATGFIGSYLAESLIKRGFEVTCLIRQTSNLKWIEHLDLQYISCDLADIDSCADKIAGFDYIFHLSGLTKSVSERDFFSANAECTKKLLRVVADKTPGISRFVYISSLAAAGPSNDGIPLSEASSPRPVSFYGNSKLEGEKAVMGYKDRLPVTVIRPSAVYGPRDTDLFVMFKMIKTGIFPYWGKCYYSLLYVEDLISGILLSAEKKEAEGKVFFLSDNMVYTNDDIAGEIALALGSNALKIRLPGSLMPVLAFIGEKMSKKSIINSDKVRELRYSNWTCDTGKAMNELGFQPKIMLREGIKWTADWYKIHRWL
jgi:nucleoside-diphosphate-sugar epimerase